MALPLRRGTDAQRLLLDGISLPVPAEGELIYTTDTKKLFVGDGSTTGGVAVDVANSSLSIDNLNDVDITSTPPAGGQSLVWNASNNEFEPGDPTVLSNKSLNSLQDVDLASNAPVVGQVLKWDGASFVPANDQSGGLVTGATYEINISGDVSGSVYADDSTLIIDGTDGKFKGTIDTTQNATFDTRDDDLTSQTGITIVSNANVAGLTVTSKNGATEGSGANLGFYNHNGTYESQTVLQTGDNLGRLDFGGLVTIPGGSEVPLAPCNIRAELAQASDGVSTLALGKLVFAVLNGPDVADAKKATLDNVGVFQSPVLQPGVYADDAARDAAVTAPAAGMIIFNTTNTKFQGYTGSAWVDLN